MTVRDCIGSPAFSEHSKVSECEIAERNELPESEAIRRAQEGDSRAFEHLYRLHSRRVYAICLRMLGNPTEAEDLTQEAFLRVFRKIHTFRGASAFSTWLHRLTVNVVLMHLRRKGLLSAPIEEAPKAGSQDAGRKREVGGPDISLAGFIDRMNLERAIARLAWTCRTVFILHDIQGFKHREIAKMIDCSVGASKGQLHRARTQLRDLLRNSLGEFPHVFQAADHGSQFAHLC
jgi:RNA polymerase sigma-70 factor, ECF subfamily